MEPTDKAPRIDGDNLAVSGEAADQAGVDALIELYFHYRELGDDTESRKWLRKVAE